MASTTRSWPRRRVWLSALRAGNVEPRRPSSWAASLSPVTAAPSRASMRAWGPWGRGDDLQRVAPAAGRHAAQLAQGAGDVALVEGVGQLPGRDAAGLAQVGLDVVDAEPGPGPEAAGRRAGRADQPLGIVAQPGHDPLAGGPAQADAAPPPGPPPPPPPLLAPPPAQLGAGAGVDLLAPAGGHGVDQRLRHPTGPPHQ